MPPDNVTNALLSEQLKAIQAKLTEHDGQFLSIESRLTALESHVSRWFNVALGVMSR